MAKKTKRSPETLRSINLIEATAKYMRGKGYHPLVGGPITIMRTERGPNFMRVVIDVMTTIPKAETPK